MKRSPLSNWLIANGKSSNDFRDLMREKLGSETLSVYTVNSWRAGVRVPHAKAIAAIMDLTGLTFEQAIWERARQ